MFSLVCAACTVKIKYSKTAVATKAIAQWCHLANGDEAYGGDQG